MADWRSLTQRLARADGALRLAWSELDSLVGGLPPSATKHRAWWSGDRPHARAWREAGFEIGSLVPGREVTFVRTEPAAESSDGSSKADPAAEHTTEPVDDSVGADLLLVTCVKTKLTRPAAAKDLYVSPLFTRQRRYAERLEVPWFILSAEHGLVAPDEWLSPYERYLPDTPAPYRTAWGRWVTERLDLLVGPLAGKLIEVHASEIYVHALAEPFEAKGARLLTPLRGLGMGQRLSWYDDQAEPFPAPPTSAVPEDPRGAASLVTRLLDQTTAVAPALFLSARDAELKGPGLYSWWIDAHGASDLSRGLGCSLEPGLIYAGLAGATRWPSGKRSTNTLWSRIAGMHLGGRHEFSTFRRTLGSVLAAAEGHDRIDEDALTSWMLRHLTVGAVPFSDPDTLGRLEAAVLELMDPPLNLQGMPDTPIRSRIRDLRRKYAGS